MPKARENNEILVRFSASKKASKIQAILDYLRYEELTSQSIGADSDMDILMKDVKKGRYDKFKKEIDD